MIIRRTSIISGITRERDLDISQTEIEAYRKGALVQNAFPHLTDSEREFFKTGVTDAEWETLKGDDE